MNNKEAIEILESFAAEGYTTDAEQAFQLAISALRAVANIEELASDLEAGEFNAGKFVAAELRNRLAAGGYK